MWKSTLQLDKYQYAKTNPYKVRALGIAGFFASLLMGYGFLIFLKLNFFYLIFFGPIAFVFIANKLLRFLLQLFYQKFDIKKHEKFIHNFWKNNEEPTVDVFLPWAGEDLEMHEEVVRAVSRLEYRNLQIYMLDDIGSEAHKALAEKYGCNYLSRPNKGQYKKSGNLQYGYSKSNGEFILILDADFIPIKEALREVIPYIASEKEIGILQTPQYFEQTKDVHNRSKIEFGGGNIVEEFYRIVMPCRDEFKAAMCVGTSAVYRRTTIMALNGTPKVHASEDLATGLMITRFGYYVKYLPLIISMGKSPETFQGYFKQHMRWCSGNLVFARYWPTAKLSLMARLVYITNPLHYMSEALTIIFSFQLLFLLYFHSESLALLNTLFFLPYIILSRIVLPFTKANKNKVGTRLAAISNSYTYLYTYIRMAIKGVPAWHPSGVKTNGLHGDFVNAFNFATLISSVYVISFIFVLQSKIHIFGNFNTYIVLAWSFYAVFWHAIFLTFILNYMHPFRIKNVSGFISKSFVFAKTNIMLFLIVALTTSSIPSAAIAISDPKAPTRVAMKEVYEQQDETKKIATNTQPKENEPAILGAETEDKKIKTYIIEVEKGDSLIKVTKEALKTAANENNQTTDDKELNYSAEMIVREMEREKRLQPGEKIAFLKSDLDNSLKLAKKRYE